MNIFGNSMTDAEPLPDFEDPTKLNEEWLARAKEVFVFFLLCFVLFCS